MDIPKHTHVCIIGAGPVGLTLANELQRYNVPFEIFERRTERTIDSKAFAIHARSLEAFRRMSVADALMARGIAVPGMSANAGKRQIIGGDLSLIASEFPYVLSIPQADTEAVLLDHLLDQHKDLHWGHTLQDVEHTADLVKLTLTDSQGELKSLSCRWLVGCDGAHSRVRRLLNVDWQGDDYDFEFLVADGCIDWDGNNTKGHTFLDPQGYVMLFPLPNGRHRLVMNIGVDEYTQEQLSETLINDLLQQRKLNNIRFHSPFWLSKSRGRRRLASQFKDGRILLAGDAAHVHSPLGGQGLNTGIQDAYQLAWRLAVLKNHESAEHSLLNDYSTERHKVAQEVLENTDKLTRLFTTRSPLKRAARNWLMPTISKRQSFARNLAATASGIGITLNNSRSIIGTRLAYGELQQIQTDKILIPNNVFALNGFELVLLIPEDFSAENYEAKLCASNIHFNKLAAKNSNFSGVSIVCSKAALSSVSQWPEYLRERQFCDVEGGFISHYTNANPYYLIVRPDGYIAAAGSVVKSADVLQELCHHCYLTPTKLNPLEPATQAANIPAQSLVEA